MPNLTSIGKFDSETQRTYVLFPALLSLTKHKGKYHPLSSTLILKKKSQKQGKEIDVDLHQKRLHLTNSYGHVCSHLQLILDIACMVGSAAYCLCAGKSNIAD